MKAEQLTALTLRVVAVIIGAYAFWSLSSFADFLLFTHAQAVIVIIYMVVVWIAPLVVALLLWWLAPRLAHLVCRGMVTEADFSSLDIERLTHGAFIVVGVWILIFGVTGLVKVGVNALYVSALYPWGQFVAYVLRCLFGLVLILGGRGLSRVLLHLRTAAREHEPSS